MIHIGYHEMDQLIENGSRAYKYAWEHYDDLCKRQAAYVLYGPETYYVGVLWPTK